MYTEKLQFLFIISISLLSCKKQSNIVTVKEPEIVYNCNDSIKFFNEAGVKFLKKEITDTNYLIRATSLIPTVEIDKDNVLYVAWYCNKSTQSVFGEGVGAYITLATSRDNGKTWLKNELLIAGIDPEDRIFEPMLWRDPNGLVHLFWSKCKKSFWDGYGSTWEISMKYNNNNYLCTSTPRLFIPTGVITNKPFFDSTNNLILISQYIKNVNPSTILGNAGCFLYVSEFDQKNNQIRQPSTKIDIQLKPSTVNHPFYEPQVVKVDSCNLLYFIRTGTGVWVSEGKFGKKEQQQRCPSSNSNPITISANNRYFSQFSAFAKYTPIGDNPPVRFCIRQLNTGEFLFVTNNTNHPTQRNNMTAYLSFDNCLSYPYKLTIDPRNGVSYPDFTQDAEGNIYLVWDRGRRGSMQDILFCTMKIEDIKSKKVPQLLNINK